MKRYEESTKIKNIFLGIFSFIVLFSLGTGDVYSKKKKLGVVEEVWGNVFLVEEGKTKQLRAGDYLYDFSEVMTEEGAQVSFSDYYDHQFHLAGSGHIKMMNKIVELVRGYLWVQSYRPTKIPFNIHYPIAPHKQKALRKIFGKKILPITEEIHKTTISLPIAPYIPKKKIKEYCLKINKYND